MLAPSIFALLSLPLLALGQSSVASGVSSASTPAASGRTIHRVIVGESPSSAEGFKLERERTCGGDYVWSEEYVSPLPFSPSSAITTEYEHVLTYLVVFRWKRISVHPQLRQRRFWRRRSSMFSTSTLVATASDRFPARKFTFLARNHSVVQSTFAAPCQAMSGGINSGFLPYLGDDTVSDVQEDAREDARDGDEDNDAPDSDDPPVYNLPVTSTAPSWYFVSLLSSQCNVHGMTPALSARKDRIVPLAKSLLSTRRPLETRSAPSSPLPWPREVEPVRPSSRPPSHKADCSFQLRWFRALFPEPPRLSRREPPYELLPPLSALLLRPLLRRLPLRRDLALRRSRLDQDSPLELLDSLS